MISYYNKTFLIDFYARNNFQRGNILMQYRNHSQKITFFLF